MSVKKSAGSLAGGAAGAGCIAACVAFLPNWEGTDYVAKKDLIGTGHPITYCHGQTDEFGKVKVGTRFSKEQCDEMLAASLPKYLAPLQKCVKVDLPDKSMAALLDAAYNAGPAAICGTETKKPGEKGYKPMSPMVRLMNAGDIRGGCNAFQGWYVRSDGQVRKGLVARRSGIGDGRKSERDLCLEGLASPKLTGPPATRAERAALNVVAVAKSCPWWRRCK